jgi:hypothetical protein
VEADELVPDVKVFWLFCLLPLGLNVLPLTIFEFDVGLEPSNKFESCSLDLYLGGGRGQGNNAYSLTSTLLSSVTYSTVLLLSFPYPV